MDNTLKAANTNILKKKYNLTIKFKQLVTIEAGIKAINWYQHPRCHFRTLPDALLPDVAALTLLGGTPHVADRHNVTIFEPDLIVENDNCMRK